MQKAWLIAITIIVIVEVALNAIGLARISILSEKIETLSRSKDNQFHSLSVHVIKSSAGLVAKGQHITAEKAGNWTPETDIFIVGVSIP